MSITQIIGIVYFFGVLTMMMVLLGIWRSKVLERVFQMQRLEITIFIFTGVSLLSWVSVSIFVWISAKDFFARRLPVPGQGVSKLKEFE